MQDTAALPTTVTPPDDYNVKFAPFNLFAGAFSTDEYDDAPRWAKILVNEDLIRRILSLSNLCKTHNLAEVATHDCPQQWDREDELRLRNDGMFVSTDDFYFSAYPKYSHIVETKSIQIKDLLKILHADKSIDGAYPGWFEVKGGSVFFEVEPDVEKDNNEDSPQDRP